MANMHYCRFENTVGDLRECYDSMGESLSRDEHDARQRLVRICRAIADAYGDDNEVMAEWVEPVKRTEDD